MQSMKKILEHATPAQTCSVLPVMRIEKHQEQTMSSPSCDSSREHKRIDLLFSKFAAFYGHIWRSQFKDESFLRFAKKEWHEGLSVFSDTVLNEAIVGCREQYEMPPTLPQMIYYCKQIKKRKEFRIKEEHIKAQKSIVAANVKQCLELLV